MEMGPGGREAGLRLDWISMLCAIPSASICWRVLGIQGNKVDNIPAGQENSAFHVQETHVRDKKKESKWTATVSALHMMNQWMFKIITTPSPGNMYSHQSQAALSRPKQYYRPTVNQLLPGAYIMHHFISKALLMRTGWCIQHQNMNTDVWM